MSSPKILFLLSLVFSLATHAHGSKISEDDKILAKYVPSHFLKTADGEDQSYGAGVGAFVARADFDRKGKDSYLVAAYSSRIDGESLCEIRVIKLKGQENALLPPTVLQAEDEVLGCLEIKLRDLDGDKIPELVVSRALGREDAPPAIFKWDGSKLTSITPMHLEAGKKVNDFRTAQIADNPVNGEILIVDVNSTEESAPKKFYIMKNGGIVLKESHSFISFLGKHEKKPVILSPKLVEDGDYYLEITNVSDHKRAVRAEVFINGSKVIKPEDFCSIPAPKNILKSSKDDDDDDGNEDHCKRCSQKNSTYAIVNMKKVNEMSVRVFGKKDSKIKITLNKK